MTARSTLSSWAVFGLAASFALFLFTFQTQFARASSVDITTTPPAGCQLAGNFSVSGTATADAPPGQLGQYHVQIDWGDGSTDNQTEASSFSIGANPDHGEQTRSFSGTHTYTTPGTYTIKARLYHSQPPGNDNQADNVDSITVCIVSPLQISKTADTSLTRTWTWSIAKTEDAPDPVVLASGEAFTVNYGVSANATPTDSNWAVSGNISITNPVGNPAITVSVADVLSQDGAVSVNCPQNTIASGATLVCTYSTSLPDGDTQTNTANVTVSGMSILNGSAQAGVDFSGATVTKVDDCATVSDTNAKGPHGVTKCAGADTLPAVWNYSVSFGHNTSVTVDVPLACGDTPYQNTASFVTDDTAATGNSVATVNFHVDCPLGCTLTQGYWKTHNTSFKGGASKFPDATWVSVGGPLAGFFLSGTSWFNVFWTAPQGNAYYILADQYMAATLNKNKPTTVPPAVQTAINTATGLFNTYTPAQIGALKGNNSLRNQFITLAGILGNYNEGNAGVPHCSEQNS